MKETHGERRQDTSEVKPETLRVEKEESTLPRHTRRTQEGGTSTGPVRKFSHSTLLTSWVGTDKGQGVTQSQDNDGIV